MEHLAIWNLCPCVEDGAHPSTRRLLKENPPTPTPPPPVGGWVRGQKKVCVPEVGFQFPVLSINFIFPPHQKN